MRPSKILISQMLTLQILRTAYNKTPFGSFVNARNLLLNIVSLVFGVFGISWSVLAGPNINYWELFPNGSSVYQSQSNGWTTPNPYSIKDIVTPEWCKRIVTWNLVGKSFIPTRSLAEWSFFKAYLPSGVSIIECPVDGVCGGWDNSCAAGNPIGYYSPGSCGGTNTWTCAGLYGGNNTSCSTPNTPCPSCGSWAGGCYNGTQNNYNAGSCGGYSTWSCQWGKYGSDVANCSSYNASCYWNIGWFGSCSVSCGGWWQYRSVTCYDPRYGTVSDSYCGYPKPTTYQQCNTQACAVNCSASWTYNGTNTGCDGLVAWDVYRYVIYQYPSWWWTACETYNDALQYVNYRQIWWGSNGWYFTASPGIGCAWNNNPDPGWWWWYTEYYCSSNGSGPPARSTSWNNVWSNYCWGITSNCWHRCVNH